MPRRWLIALVLACGLLAVSAALISGAGGERSPAAAATSAAPTATPAPAAAPTASELAERITPAAIDRHLDAILAAAGDGSRAAGTAGDRRTRRMLVERLRAAGWRVREEVVSFPYFREARPPRVALGDGARLPAGAVRTLTYSSGGTARGRVRVIGLSPGRTSAAGCRAADFRMLRRGEIAVVQRGTCTLRRKARNAEAAGAAAVLIPNAGGAGQAGAYNGSLASPGIGIPVVGLSVEAGRRVAAARRVTVSVDAVSERRRTGNVIAEAGDGPRVVAAGAHLDSVPEGPGLNDNGSGVAALLAVAEAFRGTAPPGARIRLGFWGAEELGLIGARRHVRDLDPAERRALRAYVNLDMVGTPGGSPGVYGSSADLRALLRRELRDAGRSDVRREKLGGASDHAAFASAGVPVAGIFTGLDRCYHRACDDAGNVDAALTRDIAQATATTLLGLARAG